MGQQAEGEEECLGSRGVAPERSEALRPGPLPSPEHRSENSSLWSLQLYKGAGLPPTRASGSLSEIKPLKNNNKNRNRAHRILVCKHSLEASVQGGWCRLELPEGRLGWAA